MRLLIGPRPDIDAAILEMLALPGKRSVMRRHRLENEIMRFPEAIHHVHRFGVGGHDLVGDALDESHLQPSAGNHIDDRHFLRHAQRVVAVRNGRAQPEESRALGLAGEDGERQMHRGAHASGRGVMLVDDDVETELVREHPFVEVAVVEARSDLRIAMLVGEADAQRFRILEPGIGVGLFAEAVHFHLLALGFRPVPVRSRGVTCAKRIRRSCA